MEITKGKLKIILDEKILEQNAETMRKNWSPALEKATKLTETRYQEEIQRLVDLAKKIMTSTEIFDYLPITKAGKFHLSKNILIAQSKVNVWVFYKAMCIALKLKHEFDPEVENIHNLMEEEEIASGDTTYVFSALTSPTGSKDDGTVMYLELNWFDRKKSDIPIFTPDNMISDAYRIPATPISPLEYKPGYLYETKKGETYLYLGVRRMFLEQDVKLKPDEYIVYSSWYSFDTNDLCTIQYTKKIAKLLTGCHTISDVFQTFGPEMCINELYHDPSIKFVKEVGQFVKDDHSFIQLPYSKVCTYHVGDTTMTKKIATSAYPLRKEKINFTLHMDPQCSISDLMIRQNGDYTIVLDPHLFEESLDTVRYSYYELKPGMKVNAYKKELKRLNQETYNLMELPDLFDKIPLTKDDTFGKSKRLLLSSSIHSASKKTQVGIYLKPYDSLELLRQFSGTPIPLCLHKVAYLVCDIGTEKGKAIF